MRRYQRGRVTAYNDPITRREEERRERFLEQVGQQLAKLGVGNATPPALQLPSNINPPPGGPPLPDHDHSRSGMGGDTLGDPSKIVKARGIWWYQGQIGVNTIAPGALLHVVGRSPASVGYRPDSTPTSTGWAVAGAALGHLAVDEVIADDDSTYILSNAAAPSITFEFSPITDPGTDVGWVLRIRAKKTIAAARTMAWTLTDTGPGGGTIASGNITLQGTAPGSAYTTENITLSAVQAAVMVNFTDIRLTLASAPGPAWASDDVRVTWTQLEAPMGGAGGKNVLIDASEGQTDDLTQWRDSTETALISVTSLGRLTIESGGSLRMVPNAALNRVPVSNATGDLTLTTLTLFGSIFDTTGTPLSGDIIYRNATSQWARLGIGGATQYLGVTASLPAWKTIAGTDVTGEALTRVDDTNVTLTLGGTPATALLRATSLTLGWTGQLAISRGGTGQSTALAAFNALSPLTTRGDLLTRDASNNIRLGIGAADTALRSNGTDPSWGKLSPAYMDDRTRAHYIAIEDFTQINGTTMTLTSTGTYPQRYRYYGFVDAPASSPQALHCQWRVPQDYVSGGTVSIFCAAETPAGGTVHVRFHYVPLTVPAEDVIAGQEQLVATRTTLTHTTSDLDLALLIADPRPFNDIGYLGRLTFGTALTGLTAGDLVEINVDRLTTDAGDTYAGTIRFIGLEIAYTADS